jgi:hypothetical protein
MTSGTYGGGTFGLPWGGGFGLYFDNRGRVYPQLYGGTLRLSLSAGYTPDLEGLSTGPSFAGSAGVGSVRFNAAGSGGASGFGVGTPGVGVTHGYGPYELSDDYSRPWARPYMRDSAAGVGIPNRNSVFEYGFPEPDPRRPPAKSVFDSGAPPISFIPATPKERPADFPACCSRPAPTIR